MVTRPCICELEPGAHERIAAARLDNGTFASIEAVRGPCGHELRARVLNGARGEGAVAFEIAYCPFCGRRLREG